MNPEATNRPLLLVGGGLIGMTVAAVSLHVPGADGVGPDARRQLFVALLAAAAVAYLFAVRVVLRRPTLVAPTTGAPTFVPPISGAPAPRVALPIVLAVAIAMRVPALLAPPFLSSDVYRYVWDGRMQVAGINPYRYVPADPALQKLRDAAIFPHINRADVARTIYPPVAQLAFQAVARVSQSAIAMKVAMVLFEALACWAILRLLVLAQLPAERVLIYAWNPLAVWEFAGNGHVDAIAIGLLAVALVLRAVRRDTWAGVALSAAVLVKFLPAAIAPALWRRRGPHGAAWRMPLAALALIVGLYWLYSGVGWHVLGFLPGYFGDEELSQGTGIWLLSGVGLATTVTPVMADIYAAVVLVCLGALAIRIAFRPLGTASGPEADARRVCADAAILAAAVTVAISPHYPWYFVWVALPCCVCARWSIIWLSVAPVLLYVNPWNERFFWPCLVYLPTAALAAREWWQSAAARPLDDIQVVQESS